MKVLSLNRVALALAVVGLVGLAPAAQAEQMQVVGDYVFTDSKGNKASGTLSGNSTPTGDFTGVFAQRLKHRVLQGTGTYNFSSGDSLSFTYEMKFIDEVGLFVGTYAITGGTGKLAGATGNGDLIVEPGGADGSGGFTASGTLDK